MSAPVPANFATLDESLHKSFTQVVRISEDTQFSNDSKPIPDVTLKRKETQNKVISELNQLREKADTTCQDLLRKQRRGISKKEEISMEVIKHFSALREKVNKYLYQQEQEFLDKLDKSYSDQENEFEENIKWCRSLQKTMEHDGHLVEDIDFTGDIGESKGKALEQAFTNIMQKFQTCSQAFAKLRHPDDLKKFLPDTEAEKDVLSKKFGCWEGKPAGGVNITEKSESEKDAQQDKQSPADTRKETVDLPFRYAEYISSIETRVEGDQRKPVIGGLAWVGNRLLAVDRYNKKLKLLHESGAVLSVMLFQSGDPWDVAIGEENSDGTDLAYAYVTIPNDKLIMLVRIQQMNTLQIGDHIRTVTGYCCLTFDKKNKKLVCGCCKPFGSPRIDIVCTDGTCLTSYALDQFGKPLFSYPRSVDVFDDVITVCDWNRNLVIFLRTDGYILGTYRGTQGLSLRDPMGTALDGRGNILIADCKSNKIHIVKLGGKFVGTLDSNVSLSGPREIATFTDGPPKFAVSYGSLNVQIFHLLQQSPSAPETLDDYDYYYDDYDYDYNSDQRQTDTQQGGSTITMV